MLKDNGIETYLTHNEGKSVLAARFIRTLKNKIYNHMSSMPKSLYIDKLDDIEILKWNLVMLKIIHILIDSIKGVNDKDPKFHFGNDVGISKHKNIFAKGYAPNWSEEVFIINKIQIILPWTYVIDDLNGEKIIGTFYAKVLQNTNQREFKKGKVIKIKGNNLYVKWKG